MVIVIGVGNTTKMIGNLRVMNPVVPVLTLAGRAIEAEV
jgi:hypothetical protein